MNSTIVYLFGNTGKNELYRRLSLWAIACIKNEQFDLDSSLPEHMQMTSISIFCNTASLLRTCKRHILSWIMIVYDVTPCRYCTNVSQERKYQSTWSHIPIDRDLGTAVGMSRLYTATLLIPDISHHASLRPFFPPLRHVTHRSPVFQFAMSQDRRVQFSVLQWISSFYSVVLKMFSFGSQTCGVSKKRSVCCVLYFH